METVINKKVNLNLIGIDGNAFSIMGAFRSQAKKEKWSNSEIEAVLNKAMDGDYNHLLYTIQSHCAPISLSHEDDYYDDEDDDSEWDDEDEDF